MTKLEKLRDELALDEAQFCHCSGGACSGCEKSTIKIFKHGFDKGAEEMAKIKDAQIGGLVEALEKVIFALQCNIIKHNGKVPTMTDEQVFEASIEIRDQAKEALEEFKANWEIK